LRKRNTQGLPWRVITDQWSHIIMKRELFNSLRGFSRTHTRSLYKSDIYRQGWIEATLSTLDNPTKLKYCNYSKKDWIKFLSPCTWCANSCGSKGNRLHALHFCTHEQLHSFRSNIVKLLDRKITELVTNVTETQTAQAAIRFIQTIEETILQLHGLEKTNSHMHLGIYKTGTMWMKEKKVTSLVALQHLNIPIYAHLFGFVPLMENNQFNDSNLNTAHCISLGVIPKQLDRVIYSLGENLHELEMDPTMIRTIYAGYKTLWNEIKEINEARIMGLHKIIGIVSKEYEKTHRNKYNIEKGSRRALKRSLQNATDNERCKILKKECMDTGLRGKDERKKFCTGITCNRRNTTWNFGLKPSLIRYNLRHCQRCAKQQTAFKKGAAMLDTCINTSSQIQNDDLVQYLEITSNDINYSGIAKRVPIGENTHKKSKLYKHQNKRKLTDAQKGTLKTISTCVTRLTNCNIPTLKRMKTAKKILQDTIIASKQFSKDDLQHNIDMNNVLLENKLYNQKSTLKPKSEDSIHTQHKPIDAEEVRIRGDIASALVNNQWMFSYSLDRAIRNIRTQAPNDVFIANTGISTILQNWQPQHGWRILANYFRSIPVSNRKPHGTYIIPLFSGAVTSGHWSIAIIWKQKRSCKGWILDSMGKGNIHSNVAKTIKKAFDRARVRCIWHEAECRTQIEVECGPRTICGMVSICDQLKLGNTIDVAIMKASLMHISEESYKSEIIRRTAASWMRMKDDILNNWKKQEEELRRFFRNRKTTSKKVSHSNNSISKTIIID